MELNEIKKALYKEKPIAIRNKEQVDIDIYVYCCMLSDKKHVIFEVPRSEMGETVFEQKIEAQLLIRWIL